MVRRQEATHGLRYFLSAATVLTICCADFSVVPVRAASNNIKITSDDDFLTCGCVSGGSRTQASPYLISGLTLFTDSALGILVDNTNGQVKKYFEKTGDTIQGSSAPSSFPGVEFVNLNGLGAITGFWEYLQWKPTGNGTDKSEGSGGASVYYNQVFQVVWLDKAPGLWRRGRK